MGCSLLLLLAHILGSSLVCALLLQCCLSGCPDPANPPPPSLFCPAYVLVYSKQDFNMNVPCVFPLTLCNSELLVDCIHVCTIVTAACLANLTTFASV